MFHFALTGGHQCAPSASVTCMADDSRGCNSEIDSSIFDHATIDRLLGRPKAPCLVNVMVPSGIHLLFL
jgi:hypothetical protein